MFAECGGCDRMVSFFVADGSIPLVASTCAKFNLDEKSAK